MQEPQKSWGNSSLVICFFGTWKEQNQKALKQFNIIKKKNLYLSESSIKTWLRIEYIQHLPVVYSFFYELRCCSFKRASRGRITSESKKSTKFLDRKTSKSVPHSSEGQNIVFFPESYRQVSLTITFSWKLACMVMWHKRGLVICTI